MKHAIPSMYAEIQPHHMLIDDDEMGIHICADQFTCWECYKARVNLDCEYAFDPYNTNGDCLALK